MDETDDVLRSYYALCQLEDLAFCFDGYIPAMRMQEKMLVQLVSSLGGRVDFPRFYLKVESASYMVPGSAEVLIGRWIVCKGDCPAYTRIANPASIATTKETWKRGVVVEHARAAMASR